MLINVPLFSLTDIAADDLEKFKKAKTSDEEKIIALLLVIKSVS